MKKRFSLLSASVIIAATMLLLFMGVALAVDIPPGQPNNFSQCQNGAAGGGPCNWTNGAIGSVNSLYYEGDGVPQRVLLTNLAVGTEYSFGITFGTTKGDKHAYDYLVSYNHSEAFLNQTGLCSGLVAGCDSWPSTTYPIPLDMSPIFTITQDAGVFTVFNGSISDAQYTSLPITYTGDTDATIMITFTASHTQTLFAFGGHLASMYDWGVGNSAIEISGKPYHIKINNGSDNQVDTGAIHIPSELTIVKVAIPEHSRIFTYTSSTSSATPLLSPFYLQDDGDEVTNPSSKSFPNLNAGTYTVTEHIAPEATGWKSLLLDCTGVDATTGSPITPVFSVDLPNKTVVVTLAENEHVTCTFTNEGTTAISLSNMSAGGNDPNLLVIGLLFGLLAVAGGVLYRSISVASNQKPVK